MKRPKSLLSPVLVFLTTCASPVMGVDSPPAQKPAVTEAGATTSVSKPPMVTHNPDCTFTVQKEPPKGAAKDAKAQKGLIIPPQVVVPLYCPPEKRK